MPRGRTRIRVFLFFRGAGENTSVHLGQVGFPFPWFRVSLLFFRVGGLVATTDLRSSYRVVRTPVLPIGSVTVWLALYLSCARLSTQFSRGGHLHGFRDLGAILHVNVYSRVLHRLLHCYASAGRGLGFVLVTTSFRELRRLLRLQG